MRNQNAKSISDMVNSSNWKPMEVGVELTTDHRYLQQQLFEMMLHFISQSAYNFDKGWYDERNEFTMKCCKVMYEALKDADLVFESNFTKECYQEILSDSWK